MALDHGRLVKALAERDTAVAERDALRDITVRASEGHSCEQAGLGRHHLLLHIG